MKRRLFTIIYDTETETAEFKEESFKEFLTESGWDKVDYDTELLNSLAVALGMKIGVMFKSEKVRKSAVNLMMEYALSACEQV